MKNKNITLSKVIDEHQLEEHITQGQLNLIECPCGAGKTYWIIEFIIKNYNNEFDLEIDDYAFAAANVLFLTDNNLNESKIKIDYVEKYKKMYPKDIFTPYIKTLEEGKFIIENGMEVRTYAYASKMAQYQQNWFNQFDLIICDEFHNMFKYKTNSCIQNFIPKLCRYKTVIAISATPRLIYGNYKDKCKIYDVLGKYKRQVQYYEEETAEEFADILTYLDYNELLGTTIIYTKRISREKEIKAKCIEMGYRAEYICNDAKCNESQLRLKEWLIKNERIPNTLDILIMNACAETGININNVDNVICDDNNKDTIKQLRGRARNDIKLLAYKFSDTTDYNVDTICDIIESYQGQKLFKEQQQELFNELYELGVNSKSKPCKTMKAVNKWLSEYDIMTYDFKSCRETKGERVDQRYIIISE